MGCLAAQWLINNHHADVFIGYASYAPKLRLIDSLKVIDIPGFFNPTLEYGYACLNDRGKPLAYFFLSDQARTLFIEHGFL